VRRDGQYLVRHRAGAEVHEILPWTAHEAVNPWKPGARPGADGHPTTVKNVLAVGVSRAKLDLYVNDRLVTSLDRPPYMNADGIVGLRVNHGLNLHVTDLLVEKK